MWKWSKWMPLEDQMKKKFDYEFQFFSGKFGAFWVWPCLAVTWATKLGIDPNSTNEQCKQQYRCSLPHFVFLDRSGTFSHGQNLPQKWDLDRVRHQYHVRRGPHTGPGGADRERQPCERCVRPRDLPHLLAWWCCYIVMQYVAGDSCEPPVDQRIPHGQRFPGPGQQGMLSGQFRYFALTPLLPWWQTSWLPTRGLASITLARSPKVWSSVHPLSTLQTLSSTERERSRHWLWLHQLHAAIVCFLFIDALETLYAQGGMSRQQSDICQSYLRCSKLQVCWYLVAVIPTVSDRHRPISLRDTDPQSHRC